ncbi:MAG: GAF domain-containing protein [Ardenticatenaceae bacterium]|nr:GAF domain-containing protein [Ardenticatenaceae bacterium]MCB9446071.1 GAF domain-containing protein [Ardenticatenaceae bacterium]
MPYNQDQIQAWEKQVGAVFAHHALDNGGILTSPRSGERIASQICQLALAALNGREEEAEILSTTLQLAEQGLSMTTAAAMLRALNQADWLDSAERQRLNQFQLQFLENLAIHRENAQQKRRERSQLALQQALHNQMEQQRRLHLAQEQQNKSLNEVLQLNARLVAITNETDLLIKAADGIRQALNLADVTIYDYQPLDRDWIVRTTTAVNIPVHLTAVPPIASLLNQAMNGEGELIQRTPISDTADLMTMAIILRLDDDHLSGMVTNSESVADYSFHAFSILIRTFAQNLTALWRNLLLLRETGQRARELGILHGRYLDTIWRSKTAALQARYAQNNLQIERRIAKPADFVDDQSVIIPVGDRPFGRLKLPENTSITPVDTEFAQAIIREMSNALNNAQLLQTAHAFSNQLSLAAEVSRAATTILDRAQLTQEVVELIRASFDFYYVGLFLVDESGDTAVLLAGTGEAGQMLVQNGHRLPLDGTSMISTAIGSGRAHVAQDVDLAPEFHRNPLLPDTQAELAVPLRTRGIITGALTIQSDKIGVFAQETIDVLQTLADQLAVAIVNASLFARLQDNLNETNLLYDTSRKINSATTAVAVYNALVEFVRDSGLTDAAYTISHAPGAHGFFVIPSFWSRTETDFNWREQFLRDPLLFGDPSSEKLTLVNNCQKNPGLNPVTRHLANVHQLHAMALISISIEGEWLATLALQRGGGQPFTTGELNSLLTIVDQSAVILSNQQLLRQAKTLYQVGQSLSQVLTRDDALQITVNRVAQYTGASQCRFILYDPQNGTGKIIAEHKPTELAYQALFSIKDDKIFARLSREMKPLLIDERQEMPSDCLQKYVYQLGAKATLIIPATSQQELLGFLTIESHHGTRPFTQANTIFAQTVVDHLTTQIENLNLLDEALSRAQELITLNQIQSGISGILDLTTLAQTIYDQIGRLLDNTIFILVRYQSNIGHYEPILCMQEGYPVLIDSGTVIPGSPLHRLLYSQRHLVADAGHPIMQKPLIPNLAQTPQSSMWIPLLDDNQPTGFICLQSYEKNRYSETDVQLLRSIATQTNLAIANARLFEEIQASNAQLRQLDNLKNQFLANVSHELRTPLNSIIGFSKVILKGIDGPLTTEQKDDVTAIYENGQMLLALINEILDMAKIEAGRMTVTMEQIDAEITAQKALKNARSLIDGGRVILIADIESNLPVLEADPVRLRQILNNLLSNAAKFTNEGHIRLQMRRQDGYLHIAVEDTGIGIHQQDYQKLFRPFEQIENRDARVAGGTGLGLPITQWLVQMHNGRIWLESQPGKGSIFHILLPFKQPELSTGNDEIQTQSLTVKQV